LYKPAPREQIADALTHLRGLFREISPSTEKDYRAHERREVSSLAPAAERLPPSTLYVTNRGVTMKLRFGGKAVPT
jgi:hypothetical protein